MLKKLYLFVHNHIVGFIRFWLVLLCFVAMIDSYKLYTMTITANVAIWLLVLCGQHKKWYLEDE